MLRDLRLLRDRPAAVAALLLAVVAALYVWPLVDGSSRSAVPDVVLPTVAAVALSLSALRAVPSAPRGAQVAWSALVVAAQLLAAAWLLGLSPEPPEGVRTVAVAVAALLVAGAVTRIGVAGSGDAVRRSVEIAALTCVVLLLGWGASQVVELPTTGAALAALAAAGVLAGTSALALLTCWRIPSWPVLGAGGVVVAAAVATEVARGGPDRWSGFLWCAGLVLLAAAASTGPTTRLPDAGRSGLRWALPAGLVLAAPLGAVAGRARPGQVERPEIGLGLLLLVLVLALVRVQLLLVEQRARSRALESERSALEHRAFHDDLTGLANRALFHNRLEHALAVHQRQHRPLTVLFGDLDAFKSVNDRFGHEIGNQVLREVADRLASCVRPSDTLARLSGDEFAVLVEGEVDASALVARMEDAVATPFVVGGSELVLALSLGSAHVEGDAPTPTPDDLLRQADERMFERKRARSRRSLAGPSLPVEALRTALRRALEEGSLEVVYQPLVDTGSSAVVGLEALARWAHDGEQVPPTTFVALARELGLLNRLTEHVTDLACAQLRRWCDALGDDRLTVAVNLEPEQWTDTALHAALASTQRRHGLRPGQLVLEVGAPAVLADVGASVRLSRSLADQGTPLALSGVDGQALAALPELSLSCVKVIDLTDDDEAGQGTRVRFLRALKGVGRELDLRVVVERIDRQDHLASVRDVGGLVAQGFVVARPDRPSALDGLLAGGVPSA